MQPAVHVPLPEDGLFVHQQQGGARGPSLKKLPEVILGHSRLVDSYGIEFNACPNDYFRWCPKVDDPNGTCNVCDDVTPERALEFEKKPLYQDKVVAKRAAQRESAIAFKQKANIHGWAADDDHNAREVPGRSTRSWSRASSTMKMESRRSSACSSAR